MKGMNLSMTAIGTAMAAFMAAQAFGQAANPQGKAQTPAPSAVSQSQSQTAGASNRVIVVSLQARKLALLENGRVVRIYSVAVGKPSTPSPVGTFTIEHRVVNPTYYHHGVVIPPGPEDPVGNRWMSLSIAGYGIHGTNVPSSIGKAVSHGCIRLGKADVEDLFSRVRIGDKVQIIAGSDEEAAQIFGSAPKLAAQPPTQTAMAEPPSVKPASKPASGQAKVINAMVKVRTQTGADKSAVGVL